MSFVWLKQSLLDGESDGDIYGVKYRFTSLMAAIDYQ